MRAHWLSGMGGLLLALAAGTAVGTSIAPPEDPDVLTLDGKPRDLYTYPLATWLAENGRASLPPGYTSTLVNLRGYVAHWEIRNEQLWLTKLDVLRARKTMGANPSRLRAPDRTRCKAESAWEWRCDWASKLFPTGGDVRADWYSGLLIVPAEAGMGLNYGSPKRRYLVVWLNRGAVLRRVELDAAQFETLRRERFEMFKKTPEYRKHFAETEPDMEDRTEDYLYHTLDRVYLSTNL